MGPGQSWGMAEIPASVRPPARCGWQSRPQSSRYCHEDCVSRWQLVSWQQSHWLQTTKTIYFRGISSRFHRSVFCIFVRFWELKINPIFCIPGMLYLKQFVDWASGGWWLNRDNDAGIMLVIVVKSGGKLQRPAWVMSPSQKLGGAFWQKWRKGKWCCDICWKSVWSLHQLFCQP